MPRVPHILKTLYDLDILDEEVLIEWDAKVRLPSGFYFHTISGPVML